MDRNGKEGKRWDWLPQHMPGVAALMREKRRTLGDAHVNECWRRGVVLGEPGWFFAREGVLCVGVLPADELLAQFATAPGIPGQAVLVLHTVEVADA